jgi:uncharacterized YigZ family protein
MSIEQDTYLTISKPSEEIIFKEKNSKFMGFAFPVNTEEEVKKQLEWVKKQHPNAGHYCYAYQLGTINKAYRVNDDGEPNNSAGLPIYGQILSFGLTNILIVVVRYFGGIKLGVGGLIAAYKTTAQKTLETLDIIEKTIDIHFEIQFDYLQMNKVMRLIKENQWDIVNQKMELNCCIEIKTREKNALKVQDIFDATYEIQCKKIL